MLKVNKKFLICFGFCATALTLSSCGKASSLDDNALTEDEILLRDYGNDELFAYGIAKIAGSAAEAIGRQPESRIILDGVKNTAISTIIDNKVSGIKSFSIGKLVGAQLEAIGRQPEAHSKMIEGADFAVSRMIQSTTSDKHSYAVGKFGASYMEAIGRQPEAVGELSSEFYYLTDVVIKNDNMYACGFYGYALLFEAIGRQPEAADDIKWVEHSLVTPSIFKCTTEAKALAIGQAAGPYFEAMGRQPEAIDQLTASLKATIDDILRY